MAAPGHKTKSYERAHMFPNSLDSLLGFHMLRVIIPTVTKITVTIISGTTLMQTFAANEFANVGSLRKKLRTEYAKRTTAKPTDKMTAYSS